jgi:hypothetical protein
MAVGAPRRKILIFQVTAKGNDRNDWMSMSPDFHHALVARRYAIVNKVAITQTNDKEVLAHNVFLASLACAVGRFERASRFVSVGDPLQLLVPDFKRTVLRRR